MKNNIKNRKRAIDVRPALCGDGNSHCWIVAADEARYHVRKCMDATCGLAGQGKEVIETESTDNEREVG